MIDQRIQSARIFARINLPIAQGGAVIIAATKPAVIENKPLGTQIFGAGCDVL